MLSVKTKAIVLRKNDLGESQSRFVLYTQELGKIQAILSGTNKLNNKLYSHLASIGLVNIDLIKTKQNFKIIGTQLISANKFKDEKQLAYLQYFIQSLDKLTFELQKDQALWDLINSFLQTLHKQPEQFSLLVNAYLLKLIAVLGFEPQLLKCYKCQKHFWADQPIHFDAIETSLVHEHCIKNNINEIKVTSNLIKFLRLVYLSNLNKSCLIVLKKSLIKEIDQFTAWWLKNIIGYELKTRKFINSLV